MSVDVAAARGAADHALALRGWLAEHEAELAPYRTRLVESIAAGVEHDRGLMALLHDAGWGRWGWPAEAGGLGGPIVHRAVLYDELASAGIEIPEAYVMMETLASLLVSFAPDIAAEHLPAFLQGKEIWAQGFSEPEAGSDLAHLRTRATAVDDGGFRLSGQKTWTTLGQFARYAAVLARTGDTDSAHRGLTMLWVDLEAPGVEVRPIVASNGREEFAEMFFDDTPVPSSSVIGEVGGGWAAAMYLLQFERGMYAWLRQAVLHRRLREAVETAGGTPRAGVRRSCPGGSRPSDPCDRDAARTVASYRPPTLRRREPRSRDLDRQGTARPGRARHVRRTPSPGLAGNGTRPRRQVDRPARGVVLQPGDHDLRGRRRRAVRHRRRAGPQPSEESMMEPEERTMLGDLASRVLSSDQPEDLLSELVDSGMADEVWADDLAVALLFAAHGAATAATTLLDHYAIQPDGLLPGRLVLPPLGSATPPGRSGAQGITVDGIVLAGGEDDGAYVIGTDAGQVFLIDASALEVMPAPGFDPDLRVVQLAGTVQPETADLLPGQDWNSLAVRAARGLAFELLGIAGAALDRATTHVLERHQFGRPLGAFQVVRHRLAGVAVARTGAEDLALASGPDVGLDEAVLVVKAAAGRAALSAVAEAQQVCGGMGFTQEFELHSLVRRTYLLDSVLGRSEDADFELGRVALATGRIPEPEVTL